MSVMMLNFLCKHWDNSQALVLLWYGFYYDHFDFTFCKAAKKYGERINYLVGGICAFALQLSILWAVLFVSRRGCLGCRRDDVPKMVLDFVEGGVGRN